MIRDPIDPTCLCLRPLAEYSRRLPSSRSGKRLHRATLWRWALRGARGRKLRTAALGGSRVTCDAWVWEFLLEGPPLAAPSQLNLGMEERRAIEARFL